MSWATARPRSVIVTNSPDEASATAADALSARTPLITSFVANHRQAYDVADTSSFDDDQPAQREEIAAPVSSIATDPRGSPEAE